ncbi:MAG: phosphoglycerate kinase [Acidobacteriota bacterium]|nr:phosphoglycerate kinase [Acidobacteriota bacterium]NLT32739.1 phosphoglycerate kinase [Acidobacteriota bacterium]
MAKLTLEDLDLEGKRVFVRVDFNVPIKDGKVVDDLRIREALPTVRHCLDRGAVVVLASHLGRPKGKPRPEFSLAPVARRLEELLGRSVRFAADCIGPAAAQAVEAARPGEVVLLENLRFHPGEEAGDPEFARELAARTPLYINDAFGCAHRAHASVTAITRHVEQAAAGFLMEKELRYLGGALETPDRPFVAILGGAKISDKIEVIENLLGKVDRLLIGGAMMFTFLKSQGKKIGRSMCEEDKLDLARALIGRAGEGRLMLPVDAIASGGIEDAAGAHAVPAGEIPDDEMGLDIGPQTTAAYAEVIRSARTIVWNGPMGVFEQDAFASGTLGLARAVADSGAVSIVGGGDSAAAVAKAGVADRITHVSTGGGASLEFLAGRVLPGVAALSDGGRREQA